MHVEHEDFFIEFKGYTFKTNGKCIPWDLPKSFLTYCVICFSSKVKGGIILLSVLSFYPEIVLKIHHLLIPLE